MLETDLPRLSRRIRAIDKCLRQAGLQLAKEKTKIVSNDHYKGCRKVGVGGDVFEIARRDDALRVLGLSFSLSRDPSLQAKELIGRTREAAAAHMDILEAPGPWMHKLALMRTLVESQFSWVAGSIHWSSEDLHSLNVLQLHTCRRAFGLKESPKRRGFSGTPAHVATSGCGCTIVISAGGLKEFWFFNTHFTATGHGVWRLFGVFPFPPPLSKP